MIWSRLNCQTTGSCGVNSASLVQGSPSCQFVASAKQHEPSGYSQLFSSLTLKLTCIHTQTIHCSVDEFHAIHGIILQMCLEHCYCGVSAIMTALWLDFERVHIISQDCLVSIVRMYIFDIDLYNHIIICFIADYAIIMFGRTLSCNDKCTLTSDWYECVCA